MKARLIEAYELGDRKASGTTKVVSLGFSSEPKHWRIHTKIVNGRGYDHSAIEKGMDQFHRADVHISAVVSRDWLKDTWALDDGNAVTAHDDALGSFQIIMGIRELPAPAGIDRLELVCHSVGQGNFHLSPRFSLRFTTAGFTDVSSITFTKHPANLNSILLRAGEDIATTIARKVAERLNPKPKPKQTISSWAQAAMNLQKVQKSATSATLQFDELAAVLNISFPSLAIPRRKRP